MLLVALPPPALADELPKAAQELIDEAESLLETCGKHADETYSAVLAKLK